MLGIGGSTDFELPKTTNWSANGWGLHFLKPEDEKVYLEEQVSTAQEQMTTLKHRILATCASFMIMHVIGMAVLMNFSSRYLLCPGVLILYATLLGSAFVLHVAPIQYPEHTCCGVWSLLMMAVLFTNPIRLHRLSLQSDVGPFNEMWISFGNGEFVESARDTTRMVWIATMDTLFHQACNRIRTKVSAIKMLTVVIFFSFMLLSSIDNDTILRQPSSCSTAHAEKPVHEDTASDICLAWSPGVTTEAGKR
jgi:hypothetical protein